jgi:hypothetical protein
MRNYQNRQDYINAPDDVKKFIDEIYRTMRGTHAHFLAASNPKEQESFRNQTYAAADKFIETMYANGWEYYNGLMCAANTDAQGVAYRAHQKNL